MGTTTEESLRSLTETVLAQETILRRGGDEAGFERQRQHGRLPARERVALLIDEGTPFLELNLWAAHDMYPEVGDVPAAGLITGIGTVHERQCMIIACDATAKEGVFFPQTCKKMIRAQRIAFENALPILYLVDSAGIYLPLQEEIFPDEDDFGRILRNNAVISAAGLPQYAAIMGDCIAGFAYIPVLCDKTVMTDGSALCLGDPALVKAAIGQKIDAEELGGATMHAEISGTIDFREPDDPACIERLRSLVDLLQLDPIHAETGHPEANTNRLYDLVGADGQKEYEARDLIACVIDAESFQEVKSDYGQSLVCGFARIGGAPVGIIANQRKRSESKADGLRVGGVIYPHGADKAARFIMDCNQTELPIIFFQDVMGFMVGRKAEQDGIIRSGAKLVSALSNSVVPKIIVIVGGSFGAGNYAMCGKAYDPRFIFAWPSAKYAVMGADQASDALFDIQKKAAERGGNELTDEEIDTMRGRVKRDYERKTDIRYGAARGWVDGIIAPHTTRDTLVTALALVARTRPDACFHTGVFQT